MADRRYGPRPTPPFFSDHWIYAVRCSGEPGTGAVSCPRCKTTAALELARDEIPQIGGPPVMVQITCEACSLPGVIVLGPPAATRPPATFLREPRPHTGARFAPAPSPPPVADADPQAAADDLLTLAGWQQLGIGLELHPNTAAAVPRASDEKPGRRDEQGLRLYSEAEIRAAIARQHRHPQQPPTAAEPTSNQPQEGDD